MDAESDQVELCIRGLQEQLSLGLSLVSTVVPSLPYSLPDSIHLESDVDVIEAVYPGLLDTLLDMIVEIEDVLNTNTPSFLRSVRILPRCSGPFNPLIEFRNLGLFTVVDIISHSWDYSRLAEYHSLELLLIYIPSRYNLMSFNVFYCLLMSFNVPGTLKSDVGTLKDILIRRPPPTETANMG
eukprot:sb/3471513/